jgi:hypothetical protein
MCAACKGKRASIGWLGGCCLQDEVLSLSFISYCLLLSASRVRVEQCEDGCPVACKTGAALGCLCSGFRSFTSTAWLRLHCTRAMQSGCTTASQRGVGTSWHS